MRQKKGFLRKISVVLVIMAMLIIMFNVSNSFNHLVSSVTQLARLIPIYKVDSSQQAISISFDASWGAEKTREILDILDKYNVKTTFFLVNIWLEDYPDMAREIVSRGHELGLHSVTHPHFTQISQKKMESELTENFVKIKEITGYEARLFRAPFGDYNNTVISTASSLGYICVQWSVEPLHWI